MEKQHKQIQPIKQGDEKAFKALFHHHYPGLYRYCRTYIFEKETAEELVQDVFIHLWENRQSLIIKHSLSAYLHASVKNKALNYLKSKYARQKAITIDDSTVELEAQTLDSPPDQEKLYRLAQEGIQQLPERCRIIFTLSRQAGLTYDEIAEELSISKESVKSQIKIALQKLRRYLNEHWELWLIFFYPF